MAWVRRSVRVENADASGLGSEAQFVGELGIASRRDAAASAGSWRRAAPAAHRARGGSATAPALTIALSNASLVSLGLASLAVHKAA
jgi:hypothetical protein